MKFKAIALFIAVLFIVSSASAGYLISGKNYVPNRIVVNFHPEVGQLTIDKSSGAALTGIYSVDELNVKYSAYDMYRLFPGSKDEDMKYYYVIRFNNPGDLEGMLSDYASLEPVEHTEPISIEPLYVEPNDPSYGNQWHLPQVHAPEGWDIEKGDPNVVIAIPDTGVDWDHPDLADHIWINSGEDLNGNHHFDNYPANQGGDIDNIDNDNNGYVDDVLGWDWVNNAGIFCTDADCDNEDNNPMDYVGHGTHCSGIAAAVTDNDIGVAGLDWNGTIMPLRIGYQYLWILGVVQMDWAASAINYATEKGAKVISCSWGSENTGGIGAAVDNAVAHGVLIFSAAGNSNNQQASYLCSREDVISVAATDQDDHKASFSSYGTWVDVSAPGVHIYSTVFNNSYTYFDGTSMASPLAAGLAGLVYSRHPDWNNSQVAQRIFESCDNIDDINPNYAGKLGYGRINAYNAVQGGGTTPDVSLNFVPENPPIEIHAPGTFYYDIAVTNNEDHTVNLDCWTMLTLPNGNVYGPLDLYHDVPFAGNHTTTYDNVAQYVPSDAPIGTYTFWGYIGDYPTQYSYSSFNFTVLSSAGDENSQDSWVWKSSGAFGFGGDIPTVPTEVSLEDCYPNPFNAQTNITFNLPKASNVELSVYNLAGRKVATLAKGTIGAGSHTITWDAYDYSSGVYFYRLSTDNYTATKRMTLMK